MNLLAEKIGKVTETGIFTFGDVVNQFPDASRAAVYCQVQRLLKSGEAVQVRRGLYHLSPDVFDKLVSVGALANLIYGPSYVSFEYALAYHGWIPEAVRNCGSVTSLRPRQFETPHGRFSYTLIKQSPLLAGVVTGDEGGGAFLVASPLKALADLVSARRLDWKGCRPIVESLRVEPEDLESLGAADFETLEGVYRSRRAGDFLSGLRKELGV